MSVSVGGAPGAREGPAEELIAHEPGEGPHPRWRGEGPCASRLGWLGPAGFAWAAGGIDPVALLDVCRLSVTPRGQGWLGAGHPV